MKSLFFATSVHMFLSARLLIYKNINSAKTASKNGESFKFASGNSQHNKTPVHRIL